MDDDDCQFKQTYRWKAMLLAHSGVVSLPNEKQRQAHREKTTLTHTKGNVH